MDCPGGEDVCLAARFPRLKPWVEGFGCRCVMFVYNVVFPVCRAPVTRVALPETLWRLSQETRNLLYMVFGFVN